MFSGTHPNFFKTSKTNISLDFCRVSSLLYGLSTPIQRFSLILCNHGNWQNFFFFFSFRRLLSECEHPVTKRMSKNFSLAPYIVQRQLSRWSACPSWWSDAWSCVHLPGHFFFLCISAHFTHLLTADCTHCDSTAPTYCTCVTGCMPPHAHATKAGSL